jgi:PKHD-type hydroxylase
VGRLSSGPPSMMLHVPAVLTPEQVDACRDAIDGAPWIDGNATSGFQSAKAKQNLQLPQDSAAGRAAGDAILTALNANLMFVSGALPRVILPPLFNRYGPGHTFGNHIDNSIRRNPQGGSIRADLSATLFLADPDSYDGGKLIIEDTYGLHEVKLAAGDLILYPSSSIHRVTPVTRGERVASFFWIQSYVRSAEQRALLFDMDIAIQRMAQAAGQDDPSIISLTGTYHNLLRMWAEA